MTTSDVLNLLERDGAHLELSLRGANLNNEHRTLISNHRSELIATLAQPPATIPSLPWQLERLISAAASGVLDLSIQGIPDVPRYVMGWAASYLLGDREHCLERLWQVYRVWQDVN